MEKILEVKILKVELEGEIILHDIQFELKEGETLVILGPNGAGKTILLKTLLGLLPYEGEITWKKGVKRAYVPQRLAFYKETPITVGEFFYLKKISTEKTIQALMLLGIEDAAFLKKRIGSISSGQFQRVLIAWALVDRPDILLFDEPTTGIDVGGEETVYNLLHKIQEETHLAILLVTHELNLVYREATKVLCLNKKTICYGPSTTLLTPNTLQDTFGSGAKYFQHTHE